MIFSVYFNFEMTHTHTCVHTHVRMCIFICVNTYTGTHTQAYVHTYVHTYKIKNLNCIFDRAIRELVSHPRGQAARR